MYGRQLWEEVGEGQVEMKQTQSRLSVHRHAELALTL